MRWTSMVLLAACAQPAAPSYGAGTPAERPLFAAALWDDGNAEVASYRARERRYGSLRDGAATLILVKETLDADSLVKDDGPARAARRLEVLKLNHVVTIPTGVYTYRQMASVFFGRGDGRPVKLVTSSQEWCGITNKRLVIQRGTSSLETSSYFGGEGERTFELAIDDRTVLFDALPAWVRTLDLDDRRPRRARLVSRQLDNRAPAPSIEPARITVGSPRAIHVPAGRFEVVAVTVAHAGGRDVFHLDRRAPHTLVRWDRSDGGAYELEWVRRARYWELHDLDDVGALGGSP